MLAAAMEMGYNKKCYGKIVRARYAGKNVMRALRVTMSVLLDSIHAGINVHGEDEGCPH